MTETPPSHPPADASAPIDITPELEAEIMARAFARLDQLEAAGEAAPLALEFRDELIARLAATKHRAVVLADPPPESTAPPAEQPAPPSQLRPPRRQGRRLDWMAAAAMLARGVPIEEVACKLGGTPAQIWRNLGRSRKFTARIRRERFRLFEEADLALYGGAQDIAGNLLKAAGRNDPRVLLYLAEELKSKTQIARSIAAGR